MSWVIAFFVTLLLLAMYVIATSSVSDPNGEDIDDCSKKSDCHCSKCCHNKKCHCKCGERCSSSSSSSSATTGGIRGVDGPSKVELFGREQYIKIDNGFIRQLVRIDLMQVDIVTNGSDYVKIWVLDDPSNVSSTHNSLYNWYDMPDSYLPSSGFMPFIFVQGNDRVKMDINYPVKQILVEARLTRSIS